MPLLDMALRQTSFNEVAQGYDEETARREARRCLRCKNKPCVAGCPVQVAIPEFISAIACGNDAEAYDIIRETNALPAICGRVCPQEMQCERRCVRGIKGEPVAIGRLERYAADTAILSDGDAAPDALKQSEAQPRTSSEEPQVASCKAATAHIETGKKTVKAAVIGSGPAGLSGAGTLARLGFDVAIFEALHEPGGVLTYGIPEFRLPKALVKREIDSLRSLGVRIETNTVVGKSITIDDLREDGYAAFLIGTGAGLPSFLRIPGESLNGVYTANEFLTRINLMKAYMFPDADTPIRVGKKTAVFGGGNVAMDAARCALRMGADVSLVYRRGRDEMPARAEEIEHAQEEGVRFELLTNPIEFLADDSGTVRAARCVRMELGTPDASGRRKPRAIEGSEFELACDTAVIAIGNSPNPVFVKSVPELARTAWGGIDADPQTGKTNLPGVYAAGDAVTGAATVILAMGAGRRAAQEIVLEYNNSL
jgi:glutamate synthase (NADPH/NADH) small chain